MTTYDAAMAGVIVAGMVWGAYRGITWQVASILSLVLGYSAAQPLSTKAAPYFPGEPVVARAMAMIAVYFAVSGGVFLAAWLIRATLRQLKFEAYDRHLGMVLGGLEGAFVGLIVTFFVVSLAPQARDPIFHSPTGRVVCRLMDTLGPVLPAEARRVLDPFFREMSGRSPAVAESEAPASPAPARAARPEPASASIPVPAPRVASRPEPAPPARPTATAGRRPAPPSSPTARDDQATPASFRDFLDESQRRIGRAVIEGAAEGFRKAAEGGLPDAQTPQADSRPRTPARR